MEMIIYIRRLFYIPNTHNLMFWNEGTKLYHSALCISEVDQWSYTSAIQHVFMAWCFVNYSDDFTFELQL
jgi:hypothetical protein